MADTALSATEAAVKGAAILFKGLLRCFRWNPYIAVMAGLDAAIHVLNHENSQ